MWKDSPVFPNYYKVSDKGEVYSVRTGKNLKLEHDRDGYLCCTLCVYGERKTMKVHRLVGEAFIPNPEHKSTINHKNGVRDDNAVCNLEWATNKEQSNDPLTKPKLIYNAMKRDFRAMNAKRNESVKKVNVYKGEEYIGTFLNQREASQFTGVCASKVSLCCNSKTKQCKGYTFVYAADL